MPSFCPEGDSPARANGYIVVISVTISLNHNVALNVK